MKLRRSAAILAVAAIAVLAMAAACAHSQMAARLDRSSAYKPDAGPFAVKTIDTLILHDTQRGKDLAIKVYYPDAPGPFPVIVFSHGFGGSKEGASQLAQYWASHGYVTLHPTHADSGAIGRILRARLIGQSIRDGVENGINAPEALQNRAKDVTLVIHSLADIEKMRPELAGKLDHSCVGVGGHSFGAGTVTVVGGATLRPPGHASPISLRDKRALAVLALSGQGKGQMGFTADSWKGIAVPFMSMTGSKDMGVAKQGPGWKREAFDCAPPGDKYHVFIEGATHGSFVGGAADEIARGRSRGPLGRRRLLAGHAGSPATGSQAIFGSVKCASLAFWDAYLKHDSTALAWLRSDQLSKCSHGIATLHRR